MEAAQTRTISFLPWLRISEPVCIGRFTFTSFLDRDDQITESVREIGDARRHDGRTPAVRYGFVDGA
jgi:hypothetical protein